ncbi:MAG: Serine/threonine-protein kinase PknD [Anaerolineales bacterium]|nr:Serine/threonine-protein kinase PknD [Anaerolineales bacterium]
MAGLIGKNLGRYEIRETLGEGGMATVYKAYDTRLEREVALKVIRREAFLPEEMEMLLKRFEREAKLLGRLSHPNIVGVIDYGEHEGLPYLVMVYVSGGTLKQLLGKPIHWKRAVELILPVARALEYVHEHNIINRDVKPSNILMTEKGQPMLSDFGLVKLFGEKSGGETNVSLTSSGAGLGTPDYMAPEQWTGEATAQSDLYSLGVVLYEMITGHRPYTADTPAGVLVKQATEPLPLPKNYISDLPENVEAVILKVLAKRPEDRYPSVESFADELNNLLTGREVTATAIKTEQLREMMTGKMKRPAAQETVVVQKRGFPLLWLGLALIAILALAGGFLAFSRSGIFAPPLTATETSLPAATFTMLPLTATLPPTVLPTSLPTDTPIPTATGIPAEITDWKNVPMRYIPAGEFTMGSDDTGDINSRPESAVFVEAFYIDKYEVTNEMYTVCSYAIECRKPLEGGSRTRPSYFDNAVFANYPVLFVDWKMAKAYCEWRGARLPTESEWEKAARGTDARLYPWGDGKPDCDIANVSGCIEDTSAVDQFPNGVSIYGVYGLAGNVWEWTNSLFDFYPYDPDDGREDPKAFGERVARGGSWHPFGGGNVRSDSRLSLDPAYAGAYVGFRCASDQPKLVP